MARILELAAEVERAPVEMEERAVEMANLQVCKFARIRFRDVQEVLTPGQLERVVAVHTEAMAVVEAGAVVPTTTALPRAAW